MGGDCVSWEQDISRLLESLENAAIRFDIDQHLNGTEKATARNNIEIGATATQIEGNDYEITFF
jgi:hypothetical protein